jgi:hypothetical protein
MKPDKTPHSFTTRAITLISGCVLFLHRASAGEVILEDKFLRVAFDSDSGALTRLEDKSTHWTVERRPELGMSFRLHAPLPDQRDNFVLGAKQHASEVQKISDAEVRLEWKNLVSEHGGTLPMTFTASVTLTNGVLTFGGALKNDSSLSIETLDYPYFGDLNPPKRDAAMSACTMWYGNLGIDGIYPNFGNEKGYWGVDFPTKTFGTHRSLFCLIQAQIKASMLKWLMRLSHT